MLDEKLIESISKILKENKKTISIAESCTGGLLTYSLVMIPGSSSYLKAGIVAYSKSAKENLLNIPKKFLEKYGQISHHTAIKMATNIKKMTRSDMSIATTGIAGPSKVKDTNSLGLIYIAIVLGHKKFYKKLNLKDTRLKNIETTVNVSLKLLKEKLT